MSKQIRIWLFPITLVLSFKTVSGSAIPKPPVVLELFESQGCSSCPPAEKVLAALQQEFQGNVIPLVFHVDYWNHLGWKDTFSGPRNTERQKEYAKTFQSDTIYTPELVVDGEQGFNGSDLSRARSEIAARQALTRPSMMLQRVKKESIFTFRLPRELQMVSTTATVVLFENALAVEVLRGENAGRTMSGEFAVRRFWTLPRAEKGFYQFSVLDKGDPSNMGVAVLIQDASHHILAAQSIYPL